MADTEAQTLMRHLQASTDATTSTYVAHVVILGPAGTILCLHHLLFCVVKGYSDKSQIIDNAHSIFALFTVVNVSLLLNPCNLPMLDIPLCNRIRLAKSKLIICFKDAQNIV